MVFESEISSRISSLEKEFGKLEICHATSADLPELIELYKSEGLDLRRLVFSSTESFPSIGESELKRRWQEAIELAKVWVANGKLSQEHFEAVIIQSQGLLNYQQIPIKNTLISDPFNMGIIETESGLEELQRHQPPNIVILRVKDKIASTARILFVEGSWEIVSIVTQQKYRGKGLASQVIQETLKRYTQRPLFSFQQLHLVNYYLREYKTGDPVICPFEELPSALQRDLFRMNIFWGPNVIIKIGK